MSARPETENTILADTLAALLAAEDSRTLEQLLKRIKLDAIATNGEERTKLLNAVASATARCWVRRSCCD